MGNIMETEYIIALILGLLFIVILAVVVLNAKDIGFSGIDFMKDLMRRGL